MAVDDTRKNLQYLKRYEDCLDALMDARSSVLLTSDGYDGRIRREIAQVETTVLEAMSNIIDIEVSERKGE